MLRSFSRAYRKSVTCMRQQICKITVRFHVDKPLSQKVVLCLYCFISSVGYIGL